MKRLLTLLTIGILGVSSAVARPNSQDTIKKKSSTVHTSKSTTRHLKKDGTSDKRYKENRTTTVHMKKDSTPDRRYKENKKTTKTTKSATKQ